MLHPSKWPVFLEFLVEKKGISFLKKGSVCRYRMQSVVKISPVDRQN